MPESDHVAILALFDPLGGLIEQLGSSVVDRSAEIS